MAYEVFWEARGAYRKFAGHVTGEELVGSVSRIYGDPRFDDLRYVINDFLAVESFAVTTDNVTYIAAIDGAAARSNPDIKVAIVVTEAQGKELAMHYAESPLKVYPTRIVASVDEARAWLRTDQPASNP